jgi:hypothetical protein
MRIRIRIKIRSKNTRLHVIYGRVPEATYCLAHSASSAESGGSGVPP